MFAEMSKRKKRAAQKAANSKQIIKIIFKFLIEKIVLYVPALCKKMGVPYCIVKGKARLGQVVRRKTATALAITNVNSEDKTALNKLIEVCKTNFNERYDELKKHSGGGILGAKSLAKIAKLEKLKARELQQKLAS
jgi:large subunit ribosomal protein L7Ae